MMWGSEETCFTLPKPRQFPVETFGCDISQNACSYSTKAGIFDDTLVADLNNLNDSQRSSLKNRCRDSNILLMNSLSYVNDGVFDEVLEWFASGTDPGMIIVGFSFPYGGVERCQVFKKKAIEKLDFFNSIPARNRFLDESERQSFGKEFGTWEESFYDCWMLTRKVPKNR